MREVIEADGAPGAVGPYSQAIASGDLVWVSGQIGMAPDSGRLVEGGVEAETRQALRNLAAVLAAAGSGLDRVVRVTVYLTDMTDFEAVNRIYAESFPDRPPARVCVEVSRLPKEARVEVDAIALRQAR